MAKIKMGRPVSSHVTWDKRVKKASVPQIDGNTISFSFVWPT
jgi:hypothetical protein